MKLGTEGSSMIFDLDGVDLLTIEIRNTVDAAKPWVLVTDVAGGQRGSIGFADTLLEARELACTFAAQVFAQISAVAPGWTEHVSRFAASTETGQVKAQ